MKRNSRIPGLILLLVFVLACEGGAAAVSTATPQASATPLPTNTPMPKPTSTSLPTATLVPTPAPIGSAVTYGSLEITVLGVLTHDLIVPGGKYYYYTDQGKIFIDVGVLVRNLDPGNPVQVQWGNIGIQEENGDSWYPGFADTKTVESGTKYDPFNIGIATEVKGDDFIEFDNDTYMRLVFVVEDDPNQTIVFGIENSPLIAFQAKK